MTLIKTNKFLCVFNTKTSMEEEVTNVPSTNNTALTYTTAGQLDVVGALSEDGFLAGRQTLHTRGRGYSWVCGRLYMIITISSD